MNVLLSIKPEYAQKILDRDKKYEFRRTSFRDANLIEIIYMYATSPVQRIVGSFKISEIIQQRPEYLWDQFGSKSGINDRTIFMNYFSDTDTGYAMRIEEVEAFDDPIDPRKHARQFNPPVSFKYINGELDLN